MVGEMVRATDVQMAVVMVGGRVVKRVAMTDGN